MASLTRSRAVSISRRSWSRAVAALICPLAPPFADIAGVFPVVEGGYLAVAGDVAGIELIVGDLVEGVSRALRVSVNSARTWSRGNSLRTLISRSFHLSFAS